MGPSIRSSKGPTCEPSSTSLVVSAAATTRPVSASTPMCSLRHDRRRLVPCFSTNHSPAPESFNPVLSTNRMHGFGAGRRSRHLQCLGPPAQRGMVRDGEIETEQADDGADQPFGLPQSQAEHHAQRQRCRNRQGRIVGLTAPRSPWFGAPSRDRLVAEPDRQTATLAQSSIIFRPVRYPILLPGDVMTAIGIDLERHGRTSQEDYGWGRVLPAGTAQPDLPPAEVYGPAVILTNHRELPLSEGRMVLHATRAPGVRPADPCNKVSWKGTRTTGTR